MRSHNQQPFIAYLTGSSLWVAGMSLQGFLFSWLLVGVIEADPELVGLARLISGTTPLAILLLGGVLADRYNGRSYLRTMHLLMAVPPLLIALVVAAGALSYTSVLIFGTTLAAIQAMSDPSRAAVLSRVSTMDMQRSVTLMTIVTSLAGIIGIWIGGRLESVGLVLVLCIQSALFLAGVIPVTRLPDLPALHGRTPSNNFAAGLRAVWQRPLLRDIIGLNFISSLFNAGAYIIGIPFIVKEVYQGDGAFYSFVMILFTAGSIGSNVALLRFLPLRRPGRLFLLLQLSRAIILLLLWSEPALEWFYVLILAWGINMGITTTMVRAIVQTEAQAQHRARVLSILLLSFMVSAALSTPLLGLLIGAYDPLIALLPGVAVSIGIFILGIGSGPVWRYDSGLAQPPRTAASSRARL